MNKIKNIKNLIKNKINLSSVKQASSIVNNTEKVTKLNTDKFKNVPITQKAIPIEYRLEDSYDHFETRTPTLEMFGKSKVLVETDEITMINQKIKNLDNRIRRDSENEINILNEDISAEHLKVQPFLISFGVDHLSNGDPYYYHQYDTHSMETKTHVETKLEDTDPFPYRFSNKKKDDEQKL
eukprot:TRINITY_DN185_c0_g1_i1.p1 TRINITY_DN185_c0_g1~~TRINITY_DN185_c0_g1_i1.p1  ORF type:complete len:182 (-),score=41.24 TRINITY_DN185_c0_g1_i1:86-631(-)